MQYTQTIRGERFTFSDMKELLAKSNETKSGDELAGIAARSERERVAAKWALADVTLGEIVNQPVIDPDLDDVSRLILETLDQSAHQMWSGRTVGQVREWLLEGGINAPDLEKFRSAITPEIVAALAKLLSNKELVLIASRIRNVSRCRNTLGEAGVLGIRVQPNHPTDDIQGILMAAVDGLLFGCGDAVIGINPAVDSVASVSAVLQAVDGLISRCEIPTQACCLAHITTQLACADQHVPIDLLFQSIAGTQAANASFGVSLELLRSGRDQILDQHRQRDVNWVGQDVMYFETGQGSALSAEAHHGVDQLTLEARAYGVARTLSPFLVNSVVGFIGPEYLYDERQIVRAGLEDHFMGKLLGLPMGVDVCYTNHAAADQNSADNLLLLLAAAGCNYFMGVPCSDDVMLNYQSTSFHDAALIRELYRLSPAPEFLTWLEEHGIFRNGRLAAADDRLRARIWEQAQRALPMPKA
jgi:ethanolamine ammonia-lyase large subunit